MTFNSMDKPVILYLLRVVIIIIIRQNKRIHFTNTSTDGEVNTQPHGIENNLSEQKYLYTIWFKKFINFLPQEKRYYL